MAKKQQINFVSSSKLMELTKGKPYWDLPKEEQLKVAGKLLKLLFPQYSEQSESTQKDSQSK